MFTSPSQSADSHLLHLVYYSSSACRDLVHQSSAIGGAAGIAILRVTIIHANLVDLIVLRQKGVVCVPLDLVWAVECGPVILGDWCIQLVPPWQVRVGNPGATIADQVCVVCLNSSDAILTVIPAQKDRPSGTRHKKEYIVTTQQKWHRHRFVHNFKLQPAHKQSI